jgi:Sulfite exporter TauE/SafE
LEYYRNGNVDIRAAVIIAITVLLAGGVGAVVANRIAGPYLRLAFGIFVVCLGLRDLRRTQTAGVDVTAARKRRPAKRPAHHSLWPGIAVFIVAAVVRLIVATQIADLPLSRTPHYDSLEYLSWTRRIAAGDFTWPTFLRMALGYPYFLGALLALSG